MTTYHQNCRSKMREHALRYREIRHTSPVLAAIHIGRAIMWRGEALWAAALRRSTTPPQPSTRLAA